MTEPRPPSPPSLPDLGRLGGLGWTRRTNGALNRRERRHLLGEVVRGQARYMAGRIRLATGRVPSGAREIAFADLRPPDSAFAREAEEACGEQPPAVIGHGYRSWAFGSGLATLDRAELDPELFYVACLLHDHGLAHPVAGQDFTLRSAERAEQCARETEVPAEAATAIGDAITIHTTPGIEPEGDGTLGFYVQNGALFDLAGGRADELTRTYREEAIAAYPRAGVTSEIGAMVKAEARANPSGRFALLRRCGFITLMKLAPLRPR
jgi:hypothetical protein